MTDKARTDQSELILHVGLPKTGTTAIQRYMYFNRAAMAEKGVFWANTHPNGIHEINDWAHHIYSHKWGGWLNPDDFRVTPDEAWEELGRTIREKPGRYIVSSERFADLLPLSAASSLFEFIRETVVPATVKVIGYVRRQDNLIESHIKELVKGGHMKGTIAEYLERPPSFVSFDRSFVNAAGILGRGNVIVRIYERERLIRKDVVADFLEVCGLPEVADPLDAASLANPSLNTLSCKVLTDPRILEAFANTPYRAHCTRNLLNQERFGRFDAFALLGPQARTGLMEKFAKGNAQLIDMFFEGEDAAALAFDPDTERAALADDTPILTVDDLVEILLALPPPRIE